MKFIMTSFSPILQLLIVLLSSKALWAEAPLAKFDLNYDRFEEALIEELHLVIPTSIDGSPRRAIKYWGFLMIKGVRRDAQGWSPLNQAQAEANQATVSLILRDRSVMLGVLNRALKRLDPRFKEHEVLEEDAAFSHFMISVYAGLIPNSFKYWGTIGELREEHPTNYTHLNTEFVSGYLARSRKSILLFMTREIRNDLFTRRANEFLDGLKKVLGRDRPSPPGNCGQAVSNL